MLAKEEFSRSALLLGEEAIDKLSKSKVAVFGIGGVGGYVCEALARTGVGSFTLFDKDTVSLSNINRQIIALHSTVGRPKVEVMKERILDINPECKVDAINAFFLPENADSVDFSKFDCVIDAVDTVSAKLEIICRAKEAGIHVISAMGAGNKKRPEMFEVSDIYSTNMCPLARVMRRELKSRGIKSLTVVYSKEESNHKMELPKDAESGKLIPASIAFSPSSMGLLIASEAIRMLIS